MDIYFQGLMVHAAKVDGSGKHVAYLIPAEKHTTLLSVDTGFLNMKETTAVGDDGTGSGGPGGTKAKCYSLTGRTWTDLGARPVDLGPLQELLSLQSDFQGGTSNVDPRSAPYFELPPGGIFSFPNYFKCQIAFLPSGNDARCVPRTVQLHIDVPAGNDVTFMIDDPRTRVVVHGDGSVWITNACLIEIIGPCSTTPIPIPLPAPHSDAYGKFYNPPKQVAPPLRAMACKGHNTDELPAPRCVFHTLDIDCASSRFP